MLKRNTPSKYCQPENDNRQKDQDVNGQAQREKDIQMHTTISAIIDTLFRQEALSREQSHTLFNAIIRGEIEAVPLAAILIALKIKGETPQEIAGAASALLHNAQPFPRPDYLFADIVGTGGDGASTINISTASAFVAACCGINVAKHGNRSVSSLTGSSDLLAALNININMSAQDSRAALDELGVCFLFAPQYHGGVRHAMPVRQQLKTRTLFNVLGPLINPARPAIQLMGVYSPTLLLPIAHTLQELGLQRAAVVYGAGLDEVALHGETQVAELRDGDIIQYSLTPADFGLKAASLDALRGGDAQENAQIITHLLQGKGTTAHKHAVAANVALLLRLFGHENLQHNAEQALSVLNSDQAYQKVQLLAARG